MKMTFGFSAAKLAGASTSKRMNIPNTRMVVPFTARWPSCRPCPGHIASQESNVGMTLGPAPTDLVSVERVILHKGGETRPSHLLMVDPSSLESRAPPTQGLWLRNSVGKSGTILA